MCGKDRYERKDECDGVKALLKIIDKLIERLPTPKKSKWERLIETGVKAVLDVIKAWREV